MTEATLQGPRWRQWVWRHERGLAAGYLAAVLLAPLVLVLPPLRRPLLARVQAVAQYWDARWTRRLGHGEALLAGGRTREAATYLEQLDRIFPARTSRHARDKERERLLLALARSEEALGRRGRALAAYGRLVAFDSLNYLNHFEQGQAARRLLGGWAEPVEARDAYAAALRFLPIHLPSVRGYIGYYMDRGEFHPVVEAYQRYLDAFFVQRFDLVVGATTRVVMPLVDGLPHWLVVPVTRPGEWDGTLELRTRGFAARVDSIEIVPALRVGELGDARPLARPAVPDSVTAMLPAEHAAYRPLDASSALGWKVAVPASGVTAVRLLLRLYKPVDRGLLNNVAKSFGNLLDEVGLKAALERSVAPSSAAEADSVLARLGWVREGRLLKPDESPF